jgi:hypothetical protein
LLVLREHEAVQSVEYALVARSWLGIGIRQWRTQRHEVTVLETGYAYRGSRYTSLSAIARLISGTHCSGPRFFGLKSNVTPKLTAADGP